MRSLGGQLTQEDREKLRELFQNDDLFEKMVERAVRGMRKPGRRAKRTQ